MKLYIHLSHDEIQREIPYMIVAETTSRSIWNTGRRRRMMKVVFSPSEVEKIHKMSAQAKRWALTTGVPQDGVKMSLNTYNLWEKLGNFCGGL